MNLYGLTPDQAQQIINHAVHARDGMITKGEMADKIEELMISTGAQPFETAIA